MRGRLANGILLGLLLSWFAHPYTDRELLAQRLPARDRADGDDSPRSLLTYRWSLEDPELAGANRLVIGRENNYLYVAPWQRDSILVYGLGSDGRLDRISKHSNPLMKGVIKVALNHDETFLAAICLRSNTIFHFRRDAASGRLSPLGFSRSDLAWPVSVAFSPDSAHLYVVDAGASGASDVAPSTLATYQVRDGGVLVAAGTPASLSRG